VSAATVAAPTPRRTRREASRRMVYFYDNCRVKLLTFVAIQVLLKVCILMPMPMPAGARRGGQPVVRGFSAGTSNLHRCCF